MPMKSEADKLLKLIHKKRHEASRLLLARKLNQAILVSREVDQLREEYCRLKFEEQVNRRPYLRRYIGNML
ncbi:hypothetical protein H1S01_17535 [Heliobacterium chlorum]|uniref:Uncharacterized protein n=1 Tax=Heliobacterium chlorum TaxID=2698 RepID=A0ABR7T890_HELCL|nr:hypothetical protein [Heliobacterium chlorum]MBC9786263.1 hypothetical protein [Heliobacterium chlorum]